MQQGLGEWKGSVVRGHWRGAHRPRALHAPGVAAEMLLGADVTGSGSPIARIAGVALIGLAAACWPDPASLGMLIHGVLATLYRAWLGATHTAAGPLLWPAVALHAVCVALLTILVKRRLPPGSG